MAARESPEERGRILLVTPQPFYEDRGTPIALRYTLRALSQLGYAVDVVCFPQGEAVPIPGVRYFRTANPLAIRSVPIGLSARKLFLDGLLTLRVRERLRDERYLCVHAVEEAAFVAVAMARRRGIPVVYDMASSLPEQLAGQLGFRSRPVQALCRRLERWLLEAADTIVCSAGLSEHVRHVAPEARLQCWRFPAEAPAAEASALEALRRELCVPDGSRVVLYSGSFAEYQGLPVLAEAIPRVLVRTPRAFFVLVGAAADEDRRRLEAAIGAEAGGRVRVLARVPRARIPHFLALADVLVSPRTEGRNLPLKIFDYMASGKPIVATDIAAHRAVLDAERAVLTAPRAEPMAGAISELIESPERASRLAEAARIYAEAELGWPSFVEFIGQVVAGAGEARRSSR